MKKILLMLLIFTIYIAKAEDDYKLKFSAYTDTYISVDNDRIMKTWEATEDIALVPRKFTYINAKKGELDLNIAQISGTLNLKDNVRGKITVHYGTLVETAYAGFPVQEAYMGYQLIEGLWIDAGYYLTHIGGESFLPKDNWLSSHSIVTYFEPFYHAGIKATYTHESFIGGLHICNGNGIFNDNNDNKSYGLYLSYKANDLLSVSYASIIGNEERGPLSISKLHQLHNICINSNPFAGLELKAQFDLAMKEKVKMDGVELLDGTYYGFSFQSRYTLTEKFRATGRVSLVNDEDSVYSTGISGTELTVGVEYQPMPSSYIRLEGGLLNFNKGVNDIGKIFKNSEGKMTNSRMSLMFNFGIWLD